jgi:hypothetical protein
VAPSTHLRQAKKEEKLRGFIEEQRQRAHAGKHDDNMLRQANRRADKKLERLGYYRSDGKPYRLYSLKYVGRPFVPEPWKAWGCKSNSLCPPSST